MARRRLYFDEKRMDPDALDVLEATALLDVTEFELFHLAHLRWFGHALDDAAMERLYLPYMFQGRVPPWVRDLARRVVEAGEAGPVDLAAFGVRPRPLTMDMWQRGLRLSLWVVVVFGTVLTGAMALARLAPWYPMGACYLPPCY